MKRNIFSSKSTAVVYLFVLIITTLITEFVTGIDENVAKDLKCIQPRPTVARNIDFRWMLSVPRWYMPIMDKQHFYRLSESLLQKPLKNISESEISLNSSCITFKWDDPIPSPKLFGFNNKTVTYVTTPVIESSYAFKGSWDQDKRGGAYITLKDNNNYVFFTNCWENGLASYNVISTRKQLDDAMTKTILDHAKALGFKEQLIVRQNYDSCPETPSQPVINDIEL